MENLMNSDKYILTYYTNGNFHGFYTSLEAAENAIGSNTDICKCIITKKIHKYIYKNLPNIIINTEQITDEETVIDSEHYITITEAESENFDFMKNRLIKEIKSNCGSFIENGLTVTLSTGEQKEFSYKLEDQMNLKEILDNYPGTGMIYYHANGEVDTFYSYDDILLIYKSLYNNKLYNQIYSQVLCDWISHNYTENNREDIIVYGYFNDQIIEKVGVRYEKQKLL